MTDKNENGNSKIMVEIGEVSLNMLIDSGASCNIIDKETWERLKQMKIKCETSRQERGILLVVSLLVVSCNIW